MDCTVKDHSATLLSGTLSNLSKSFFSFVKVLFSNSFGRLGFLCFVCRLHVSFILACYESKVWKTLQVQNIKSPYGLLQQQGV